MSIDNNYNLKYECRETNSYKEGDDYFYPREVIEEILKKADHMVSIPEVTLECINYLSDREGDFKLGEIVKILNQDPVLITRILNLANSTAFSPVTKIQTLDRAIMTIGTNGLHHHLLAIHYEESALLKQNKELENSLGVRKDIFWQQAKGYALVGHRLSRAVENVQIKKLTVKPRTFYYISLLQDIGMIVLNQYNPAQYKKILTQYNDNSNTQSLISLEAKAFRGVDHTIIGSEVISHWGLDDTFKKIIRNHHEINYNGLYCLETKILILSNNIFHFLKKSKMKSGWYILLISEQEILDRVSILLGSKQTWSSLIDILKNSK